MAKKTKEVLANIKRSGVIEEREMNLLKNRLSNKGEGYKEIKDFDFAGEETEIKGTYAKKGLKWLNNLYKTPTGKERKNNPFRYREQLALETYQGFYFDGFFDAGNMFNSFYVPIYTVSGENQSFQYYLSGGKIHIIG